MSGGWLGLDWGNVPAWVSSVLTSGSVMVASFAYRKNVLDKEAEQASKVYARVDRHGTGDTATRLLRVRNGSDSAIFAVSVSPFDEGRITLTELPALSEYHLDLKPLDRDKLKQAFEVGQRLLLLFRLTYRVELQKVEPLPGLAFRDSAGRWWARDARGKLKRKRKGIEAIEYSASLHWFRFKLLEAKLQNDRSDGSLELDQPLSRRRTFGG